MLRAERTQQGLNALVACKAGSRPTLSVDGITVDRREVAIRNVDDMAFFQIRRSLTQAAAPRIEAVLGHHRAGVALPPRAMPCTRQPSRSGIVSVVVPIYGGREVTRSCLLALSRQSCRDQIEVVIVDDACPDDDLAAEVAAMAEAQGWRYLRNACNLGFAASINRGASSTVGSAVLLLNADAILPPGAIDRLLAAATAEAVGTVVPWSNDGGFTSFPTIRKVNPLPNDSEASRIDAAARCVASPGALDIPTGTGFCMLVTGSCWDALGGLDLGYGRGYFEDVDLCLRAKRLGFRNVLAPTLYVRHVGGQSFGATKKALVADNARLLSERFPDYDPDWMAFFEGDPLAALRSDVERRLPSQEQVHVVAGRDASSLSVSIPPGFEAATPPPRWLLVEEDRQGGRRLRDPGGGIPQTLRFGVDQRADLVAYLRSLRMASLSLVNPSEALLRDLESAVAATVPVRIPITGPRSLDLLAVRSDLVGRAHAEPRDRMGRAALGQHVDPLPAPRAPVLRPTRVAALVPRPTIAVDRLLAALDRRLRAHGSDVVVFGESLGVRARPPATGTMASSEYVDALRHRDITHVLVPDADTPFKLVEELRQACLLPAAYVDWAPGRHRAASGDLALRLDETEAERVSAVVAWCIDGPVYRERSRNAMAPGRSAAASGLVTDRSAASHDRVALPNTRTGDRSHP